MAYPRTTALAPAWDGIIQAANEFTHELQALHDSCNPDEHLELVQSILIIIQQVKELQDIYVGSQTAWFGLAGYSFQILGIIHTFTTLKMRVEHEKDCAFISIYIQLLQSLQTLEEVPSLPVFLQPLIGLWMPDLLAIERPEELLNKACEEEIQRLQSMINAFNAKQCALPEGLIERIRAYLSDPANLATGSIDGCSAYKNIFERPPSPDDTDDKNDKNDMKNKLASSSS